MSNPTPENTSTLLSLSQSLAGAVENAGQSIVTVNGRQRLSSTGVVWRDGVVVTADHTVERDDDLTITLADGTSLPATLAGRDPGTDLAVLKVDGLKAPAAAIDDSPLKVGQLVLALGRPSADDLSASFGAISTVSGAWRTGQGGAIDQFIRPDLTFYPGFSGGPLVSGDGKVTGINTSRLTRSFNLTVPATTVNKVVEQLLTKGRIARGYLGLGMQPVRISDTTKAALGVESNGGLIIISLENGGPAEQAGLLIGDILVALDDKTIGDTDEIQSLLSGDRIGTPIAAKIIRGGALTTVNVTVGERPQKES